MRIVYMGTPDFAVNPLHALAEAGYEVVGVVTQPDKPKGRGKTMLPTPVKEEAMKHGFPVFQPVKVRDPEFQEVLEGLTPGRIEALAGQWAAFHREENPSPEDGAERVEALKKAWSTRLRSAFAGVCSGVWGRSPRR